MIKNRIELAQHLNTLNKGRTVGAEIGVADGRYSEILCKSIDDLELYCVDPWAKYDGNWRSDDYQEGAYQKALERLQSYDVEIIRKTSIPAVLEFGRDSLDFVFIDGAHDFDNTMLDIITWAGRVRKGGIVAGHDYYHFGNSGVIEAVNAYIQVHKIDLHLTLRDESAHKDDRVPCWWFIKK